MRAVVFGAGAWGRGLVAPALADADVDVLLVDVDPGLVDAIASAGGYRVTVDGRDRELEVDAADPRREAWRVADAVATADLVVTATGIDAFPEVAGWIAAGLTQRLDTGLDAIDGGLRLVILTAEDDAGAAAVLEAEIEAAVPESLADQLRTIAVVAPTAADRFVLTREGDAGAVCGADWTWSVARAVPMPEGAAPLPVADLAAELERRALTSGIAPAASAWLAAAAPATGTADGVRALLESTAIVLAADHGVPAAQLGAEIDAVLARIADPPLQDPAFGRHVLRRLRSDGWLLRAAARLVELGADPAPVLAVVAAALRFAPAGDPDAAELQRLLRDGIPAVALAQVTGVAADDPLHPALLAVFTAARPVPGTP